MLCKGTKQGARPSLKSEFHTPTIEEFTSAFFFVFFKSRAVVKIVNEKDSASRNFALHEASCFELSVQIQNVFTILLTAHVRWPAKNCGAFVFGGPFLCFFLLGKQKKERKDICTLSKYP
jgi:hypothetical protein